MKMRFTRSRVKRNCNHRIQRVDALRCVVSRDVKNQTINSPAEILAFGQQLRAAAILIGSRRGQQSPISGRDLFLQLHGHVPGRLAPSYIQDMS